MLRLRSCFLTHLSSPASPLRRLLSAAVSASPRFAKVEQLKNMFRWSDSEVRLAVCKAPLVLPKSKEMLERKAEFLFSEVGLDPSSLASRPVILCLSLDGRLRPRYYILKFLKANGLQDRDWNYDTIFKLTDKAFVEKYISPHKEAAPYLAQDYDAACRGEVPTSSGFALTKDGL